MRAGYFTHCSSTLNTFGVTSCGVKIPYFSLEVLNLNFIYAKFLLHHSLPREAQLLLHSHAFKDQPVTPEGDIKEAAGFTDVLVSALLVFHEPMNLLSLHEL